MDEIAEQYGVNDLMSLYRFFDRPWFSRLWVLQECVLAPQCIGRCGSWNIDWSHIPRAVSCLPMAKAALEVQSKNPPVNTPMLMGANITTIRLFHEEIEPEKRLVTVNRLYLSGLHLKCTDPRDNFYALYGISAVSALHHSEQVSLGIDIDYSRPVHEILRNATRFAFMEDDGIDLLHHVEPVLPNEGGDSKYQLPSWVPDWDMRATPARWIFPVCTWHPPNHKPDIDLLKEDAGTNRLRLRGFNIDEITRVFPTLEFPEGANEEQSVAKMERPLRERTVEVISFFQTFRDLIHEPGHKFSAKEIINTMSFRDGLSPSFEELSEEVNVDMLELFSNAMFVDAMLTGEVSSSELIALMETHSVRGLEENLSLLLETCVQLLINCTERRMFATRRGRVGVGSKYTAIGDRIVPFHGSNLPFALRPIELGDARTIASSQIGLGNGRLSAAHRFFRMNLARLRPRRQTDGHRFLGVCWIRYFIKNNEMQMLVDSGKGSRTFEIW